MAMATEMQVCPNCGEESPARFRVCGYCGAGLAVDVVAGEVRLTGTIVTSDLMGSTALAERLDPETLREVLTRYFDEMSVVYESHGGTIEKIIGDAIVAVFGIPVARNDDAVRAVSAAAESLRTLASLNDALDKRWGVRLIARTGVATGEVLLGEASARQRVLTGRTMAAATTMEQNAPPLEVLMDEPTYAAVSAHAETEAFGTVEPKGGGQPIDAYRLLSVAEGADSAGASGAVGEYGEPENDLAPGSRICQVCGEENPAPFSRCGTCGVDLAERTARTVARDTRKTVSIIFADPKPATADGSPPTAAALADIMPRYFNGMQRALDRHGATIEKFIGDAVMAVFGLPVRHEDDALRAVRAAADMQRALPELNAEFERDHGVTLRNHIGVNTGEVIAGDASLGQRLVTGDTVNVAARLEQAAGAKEILLGDLTYRLVRDAVQVEAVEPLTLKGKSEPVAAFRLLEVHEAVEGFQRRQDAPMVGREAEMIALAATLQRTLDERGCRRVTVVADAGVGKSRLIREFTTSLSKDAVVIRGRCLPYGEGITFWPLREAARDAAGIGVDDLPATAVAKLRELVLDEEIVTRLAAASGLTTEQFPVAEIFWGARRFLETIASHDRPVILVVDDIHWAETTFLELLTSLVETIDDAPVLLLCTSRHDLLEAQPDWGADENSLRLILHPLTDGDASRVVEGLLGKAGIAAEAVERIVAAAEGNPLYVEQMLSMLIDNGTLQKTDDGWTSVRDIGRLEVPPSIQALLAARLDLLALEERAVIEPASVIGQTFAVDAVTVLAPESIAPQVPDHLLSVGRKQLVTALQTSESAGESYRFLNLLIRDAAYQGLLKRSRAAFHEQFATWAEELNERQGRSQEFEEILGYHLEQAYRYLAELGTLDDNAQGIGARAAEKLASAGRRAMGRGDTPAAVNLLRRAAGCLRAEDLNRLRLLPDLGEALMELPEFEEADTVLGEAIAGAEQHGDPVLGATAELVRLLVQQYSSEEGGWSETALDAVERAMPIFANAGSHAGLALASRLRVAIHLTANRFAESAKAAEQVIRHSRQAGDPRLERRGSVGYAQSALYGPTAVDEAVARCEELVADAVGDRRTEALIRHSLVQLYGMQGRFELARTTWDEADQMLKDLGMGLFSAAISTSRGQVELLAGDLDAAEQVLERGYSSLQQMGGKFLLAGVAGVLGRVNHAQGRYDKVEEQSRTIESLADTDDIDAQTEWRCLRALSLGHDGRAEEAVELARAAVELSRAADAPLLLAGALVTLGDVEDMAAHGAERDEAFQQALILYRHKGDVVSTRRIESRLTVDAGA